jgi:hypothetical protein
MLILPCWAIAVPALAIRPTEGGLFSFSDTDTVVFYDPADPRLRVTYSEAGPNAVPLADADGTGVPDYVEDAAEVALEALDLYGDSGFRAPLTEAEVGSGQLGGSPALDLYLVDFALQSDGHYGVDRCISDPVLRCGGHLTVENDFSGYSYPTPLAGLEVVVPHELFHGVQHAYSGELPVWVAEGTAVWAERLYDEDSTDFLRFADEYLADVSRQLDNPPIGAVPSFAYGTGLWFDFLTLRHDNQLMVEMLESWPGARDLTQVMVDRITDRGDTIDEAWTRFATFNLATYSRAGEIDGYPYAMRLDPIVSEQAGVIDDDNRFYPLATTYYRINHLGGELYFGLEAAAPELVFSLHPTVDGEADSPVLEAVALFDGSDPGPMSLGDLPAGKYWLWGAQPRLADDSVKVRLCTGDQDTVNACFGLVDITPVDPPGGEEPKGCGCASGGSTPGVALVGFLGALTVRRRTSLASRRRTSAA